MKLGEETSQTYTEIMNLPCALPLPTPQQYLRMAFSCPNLEKPMLFPMIPQNCRYPRPWWEVWDPAKAVGGVLGVPGPGKYREAAGYEKRATVLDRLDREQGPSAPSVALRQQGRLPPFTPLPIPAKSGKVESPLALCRLASSHTWEGHESSALPTS